MKMRNVEDVYPLSSLQEAMLVHTICTPESRISFEQTCDLLQGELQAAAFKRAWQQVLDRHPILRSLFIWEDLEEPLQVVRQSVVLPWQQYDWRGLSMAEQEECLDALLQTDRARRIDLGKAPLMRLLLVRVAEQEHYFIWSFHHIILDGWSRNLVLKEVFAFYNAFCQDQELHLPRGRPYRDYIGWIQQQELARAERFWRAALSGFSAPTRIRTMRVPKRSVHAELYNQQHIQISRATTAALQRVAQGCHAALNSLIQGVWAVLLSHFSGSGDVLFGATVSGRPEDLEGVDTMIGMFLNILPVRVRVAPDATLRDWLQTLQAQQMEAQQYAHIPLTQFQEWSDVPWNMPLFESLLVFENYPGVSASSLGREALLKIRNIRGEVRTSYPLTLVVDPDTELSLHMVYDCGCFDATSIACVAQHLRMLLETIAARPEIRLSALPAPDVTKDQPQSAGPLYASSPDADGQSQVIVPPRTALELQLLRVWEEILQIHPIGVTDNFFDLGGHSLLALRLILRIQERLGKSFPLSLLGQTRNIRELASVLQQQNGSLFETPLVALQPRGSMPPFFCIHPGSGNIICYYNLAYQLDTNQPFYALYDPDTQKEEFPCVSLEEMAARYIEAIRAVQPEGPYLLGGFSFGGLVAFEMAQQLTRQGQQVALLAILDSGSPRSTQGFEGDDNAGYLAVITMEAIRSSTSKSLREVYYDLWALELEEQVQYVIEQMKQAGIELPEKGPRGIHHELQVFKTRTRVLQQYVPQVYPGRISFFQSSERDGVEEFTPVNESWQQFTAQPLETYTVSGYHDTILDEPNVQVLASYLQACLEKAQER